MAEACIVEAVRTPVGRRGGGLGAAHPADLGAHVLKEQVARAGVGPAAVEDVVFGCLDAVGPQAGDIARTSWLAAGLPEEVPGVTVDRQCDSSQQALHSAAQGVLSGTQDLVVAGGTRNMTQIRMLSAPIPATVHALRRTGLGIDAIDLVEINEAFAPVVLARLRETGADPARVDVNGGAIALGHPLGATGARLMTTLLHELERTGGRYGLQTMCEGGGQANVTIVERL
ncbi:beta-ketoacyl synthase N-terminal-like domain-containing protein [Streptomyces sp. NPDC049916]|uniref:thiolase family protein n=1 Tax=Streptomyces sp. NPDC049916 TaxID=3155156 RepID=UPI0034451886